LAAEEITIKRYRCVCPLPGCCGKGRSWISQEDKIPEVCCWCKRHTWNKLQLPSSAKRVTIKRYRCTCEQPRCSASWISQAHELPARCAWCKSPAWNGPKKKQKVLFGKDVVALALAHGATSMTITSTDANGNAVGAPLTIALPAKKAQPSKCATITLPKPRKVRNIE